MRKHVVIIICAVVLVVISTMAFSSEINGAIARHQKTEKTSIVGDPSDPVQFTIDTTATQGRKPGAPFIRIMQEKGDVLQQERSSKEERIHSMPGVYKVWITGDDNEIVFSDDYFSDESLTILLEKNKRYEATITPHIDVYCVYSTVVEHDDEPTEAWRFHGFKKQPKWRVEAYGSKCELKSVRSKGDE